VPAINGVSSRQQSAEFRIGAAPAEYVSNLIEVAWQKFARKIQHQRLAEAELPFVWNRYVFFIILDVVGQLIIQLVQVGKFGAPIDLARLPAQNGLMFAEAAAHADEFEGVEYFLKANEHWSAARR